MAGAALLAAITNAQGPSVGAIQGRLFLCGRVAVWPGSFDIWNGGPS